MNKKIILAIFLIALIIITFFSFKFAKKSSRFKGREGINVETNNKYESESCTNEEIDGQTSNKKEKNHAENESKVDDKVNVNDWDNLQDDAEGDSKEIYIFETNKNTSNVKDKNKENDGEKQKETTHRFQQKDIEKETSKDYEIESTRHTNIETIAPAGDIETKTDKDEGYGKLIG